MTESQTQTAQPKKVEGIAESKPKPNGTGTEVAVAGPSVVAEMAAHYGMDRRAFEETLRKTVMPDPKDGVVTREEVATFLMVARDLQLNPFTREIMAFRKKGGGIAPIVGIDGWLRIINRRKEMDGISFKDHVDNEKLVAITCTLYRTDRKNPIEITEYLAECKRNTEPWNQMPSRMLRHKATIQCARYAFGISGIQDPDEFERAEEMEARREPAPPRPTREQFIEATPEAQTEQQTVTDVESEPVDQPQSQPEPTRFPITDLAHNVGELESAEAAHEFIKNQFQLAEKVNGAQLLGAWDGNAIAIGLIREVNPALAEDLDSQFSASSKAIAAREKAAKEAADAAKKPAEVKPTVAPITKVPDPVSPLTLPKTKRDQAWGPYASWFLVRLSKMPAEEIDAFLTQRKPEWEYIQENRQANADAANAIIDSKKNPPKD